MSFLVSDVYTDVQSNLSGRVLNQADTLIKIQQTVYELTETYKFPDTQVSGPQFTLGINNPGPYVYNDFMQPADAGLDISNIDSFFIYYQTPVPLSGSNGENAGLLMKFKTIDVIELSMNIVGQTIFWTRYNGQIYFAFAPAEPYVVYCRYRRQQPFTNPVSLNDPIYMPYSWRDIVGYAASERVAIGLDLNDRVTKFRSILYGDPKWQASGGTEGSPGLLFMRTSQEQRDKQNSGIALRLMRRRVQNVQSSDYSEYGE